MPLIVLYIFLFKFNLFMHVFIIFLLILSLLEEFLRDEKNRLIFVKGFYGSGKSLFLRCLLSKLKERLKFKNENCSIKEQITVFISGFNHLSQKKKLNGWRKFLVYAIEKIRIKNNYKSHLEVINCIF